MSSKIAEVSKLLIKFSTSSDTSGDPKTISSSSLVLSHTKHDLSSIDISLPHRGQGVKVIDLSYLILGF